MQDLFWGWDSKGVWRGPGWWYFGGGQFEVNIIEFGLQAKPSNLYREIVFFSDMFKNIRILDFIDSIGEYD